MATTSGTVAPGHDPARRLHARARAAVPAHRRRLRPRAAPSMRPLVRHGRTVSLIGGLLVAFIGVAMIFDWLSLLPRYFNFTGDLSDRPTGVHPPAGAPRAHRPVQRSPAACRVRVVVVVAVVVLIGVTTPLGTTARRRLPSTRRRPRSSSRRRPQVGLQVRRHRAGVRGRPTPTARPTSSPTSTASRSGSPTCAARRVWVNFWTTWCPPCQSEVPDPARAGRAVPRPGPRGRRDQRPGDVSRPTSRRTRTGTSSTTPSGSTGPGEIFRRLQGVRRCRRSSSSIPTGSSATSSSPRSPRRRPSRGSRRSCRRRGPAPHPETPGRRRGREWISRRVRVANAACAASVP